MNSYHDELIDDVVGTMMREAAVPPSALSASDVLAHGRRGRRRRYAAAAVATVTVGAAIAVSTLVVGARPPDAAPAAGGIDTARCTSVPLALPPGLSRPNVTAADPTGRYLVGGDAQRPSLALWIDGRPTTFNVDGYEGFGPQPHGVNSHGVVVGEGMKSGTIFGWVYENGQVRRLPPLPGYLHAWAYSVNERGDIVGFAKKDLDSMNFVAVEWPAGAPDAVHALAAPASAQAEAIADDGTVVGNLLAGSGTAITRTGYRWDRAGHGQQLPAPSGQSAAAAHDVVGGYAYGSTNGPDGQHPVRWDLRTGQVAVFPQLAVGVTGTASGWFAASSALPAKADDGTGPAIAHRVDNNGPAAPVLPPLPDEVYRVSPAGQITKLLPPGDSHGLQAAWISADGKTLVVAGIGYSTPPATWHC